MPSATRYCEIRAVDINDPLNNKYEVVDVGVEQDEWPHKWNKQILTYAVLKGSADFPNESMQRQAVNLAMTMWDIEIEMDLHPVKADQNPDVRFYWMSSSENPVFRQNPSILARAWYPGQGSYSGRIEINDDHFFNLTGKSEIINGILTAGYNIITILGHEIGHMLGLTHSTRKLYLDLLDPYYLASILQPSAYDVARMLLKYTAEIGGRWHNSRMRAWFRRRMLRLQIK
jgi:hypothetical protein